MNDEQRQVVTCDKGPALVLAGAGSGKTRTLTYRVAYLLEKGVKPENILLVTFTNKAAREMLNRIEALLGYNPKHLMGGTFHHVANILCRKHAKFLGYSENFTILDTTDAADLIKLCKPRSVNEKENRFPKGSLLRNIYSLHVNCEMAIDEIIETRYPQFLQLLDEIHATLKEYDKKKKKNNVMDFDDLLVNWLKLLYDEKIRKDLSTQFKHILVDEYQDVNNLQADIILKLAEEHSNVIVVGDDAQSIYSFRGANIENIFNFEKKLENVKTYKIIKNYRSTPEILNFANQSIINNENQYFKELKSTKKNGELPSLVCLTDADEQANFIRQRILELRDQNIKLNEMAILYRAHFHAREMELELSRSGIPYVIRSGRRFFERAHIKDVLSYLRIIQNPLDEISWKRLLKIIPGIGSKGSDFIWNLISKTPDPVREICKQNFLTKIKNKRIKIKDWNDFILFLKNLNNKELLEKPSDLLDIIYNYYKEYLEFSFEDFEERKEDIEQLITFAAKYKSLEDFIAEMVLEQEIIGVSTINDDLDDDEKITLSTIHRAKGLEWKVVFLINVADGYFPGRRVKTITELEEERRLFYVGVTRAKNILHITLPLFQSAGYGTDSSYIIRPSIFINEIPYDYYEKWEIDENIN
ncbi:MAG: ATP-dependent helicase [Candidatus Lokiarchaeota archaeon]|nr:ATP-dependent helicase [Candidatus Lokiarchaeota archaeon]